MTIKLLKRHRRWLLAVCVGFFVYCFLESSSLFVHDLEVVMETTNGTAAPGASTYTPLFTDKIEFYTQHFNSTKTGSVRNVSTNLIFGTHRPYTGYLTIGIPSVSRPGGKSYLPFTIRSLINSTSASDKHRIVIVIFLADLERDKRLPVAVSLRSEFNDYINSGLIQIIQAPPSTYPNFNKLKKTDSDSIERVKWRSKQNVDYAYLLHYCQNISQYYLQLEDDVISAPRFLRNIEYFVNQKEASEEQWRHNETLKPSYGKWQCLEFSKLGFIGKLFRSSFLPEIARQLRSLYDVEPCDLLLGKILRANGQLGPIHHTPSLFQHIGKWSSLKNKLSGVLDKSFKNFGKMDVHKFDPIKKGDNPNATLFTEVVSLPGQRLESLYKHRSAFMSAKGVLREQFILIRFQKQEKLKRIVISTGNRTNRSHVLSAGEVLISRDCLFFRPKGRFVDGEYDSKVLGVTFDYLVACVKLLFLKTQVTPLQINSLEIFV